MSSTRTFTSGNPIVTLSGATTLSDADSGKTFKLSAAAGAAVTLPLPKNGIELSFFVGSAFATTNWTIVSATNNIQGLVDVNSTHVPAVNENTISFVATAETIGDIVRMTCDGTNWYISGEGNSAGSITVTAP